MAQRPKKSSTPTDWHAHVYFDASTRAFALGLRERLAALTLPGVRLGPVNEGPSGPHTVPSYEVHIPHGHLVALEAWFRAERGALSVLFHPLTADEVGDHAARALWLGAQLPLAFEAFSR